MKRTYRWLGVAAIGGMAGFLTERLVASPKYTGPVTDHFDGRRFHNQDPAPHGEGSFLKWILNRDRGPWKPWTNAPYGPPPPQRVENGRLRVTFVNHATTLIQMDGVNILTDPVWSKRVSPLSFAGPKRHRPPGIRFEDLPKVDAIVISHNHYDHLDLATLRRIAKRDQPRIFVPLGDRDLLSRHGVEGAVELDWWNESPLGSVRITLVPSQHFSARGFSDRDATLWGGYVLSGPSGNVYFAGDTGWGRHFQQIGERFAPVRLALLPIGAFRPRWFMSPVHIGPDEAVRAHDTLGASTSVAIHFGTFALGDDGETEPADELRKQLADGKERRFWVLGFGEGRDVP